jgi:hypothetical protein
MASSRERSNRRAYFNTGQRAPPPPPSSPKWNAEGLARCLTNFTIVAGVVTCLSLAVAAVGRVDSESTVVFLLLVPTFFGGACLLTLVNVSWMSRRPGKRCSFVQVVCNLVLLLMTLYVELLFWRYRRALALAILCAAAIPMVIFINMPSLFMIPEFPGEADTVAMEDDDHSLFNLELSDVEGQQQPVEQEESAGDHSSGNASTRQSTENMSSGGVDPNESLDQRNLEGEERNS